MNLTYIFLILSVFLAYFLYDTFKKPKLQNKNKSPQSNYPSKIKRNYAKQCATLKQLHNQKVSHLKYRNISIHLTGQTNHLKKEIKYQSEDLLLIKNILNKIQQKTNIYLIRKQLSEISPIQIIIMEQIPKQNIITYNTLEGGVAILRQLNCGLHIQGQKKMLVTIKQYIKKIWTIVSEGQGRFFPNELAVMVALQQLRNSQSMDDVLI